MTIGGMYSMVGEVGEEGVQQQQQPTSLASIYQARKSGDRTVNVLKKQFQTQVERIVHEGSSVVGNKLIPAHIPTRNEREVREFKKLNREKSFDEARTAVQSQIEKIFQKAKSMQHQQGGPSASAAASASSASASGQTPTGRFSTPHHGVSHLRPDEVPVVTPLPVHHGVTLQVRTRTKSQYISPSLSFSLFLSLSFSLFLSHLVLTPCIGSTGT